MFTKITRDNWLFFAIKNYNVPNLDSEQEFYEDLKRFKYIKRLFRKYKSTGELKTRLIINHIIVLQNVFGMDAACTLLFYKIERNFWALLKTFLVYLNSIQEDEMPSVKINKSILTNLGKL
jgi:hypothetical protein